MPENQESKEEVSGTTEGLITQTEADAIAKQQQPALENLDSLAQQSGAVLETDLAKEKEQQEWRERQEQEQKEWAERRDAGGQEKLPGWLEAPQNEGVNSHPPPDASPASPGKQQHQQAMAANMREQSEGNKEIVTKTQLGVLVTLDGVYVVPKYKSVTRDKSAEPSLRERFAKDQSSGRPQGKEQEQGKAKEQNKEQNRDRDRDRGMER